MIKTVAKLGIWLVVGIGSTIALLGHTNLQTSWEYTVESNIPAGTEITVIKSDDELVKISLPEDQAISKTFIYKPPRFALDITRVALVQNATGAVTVEGGGTMLAGKFVELTPSQAQEIAEKLVLLSRPHELVASKEVEGVLTDLRDLKTLRGGSVICQAAIILVSRLSREKAVTKHA